MSLIIRPLALLPYAETWQAMQTFTLERTPQTPDEIWFVQHPPVFTQGLNGKAEHLLQTFDDIPVIQTDRGGQITYHAPGQLVAYCLIDLKRNQLSVRQFVHDLEGIIIELLAHYQIQSQARADAPGVYVQGHKIASLGLKVRKQCTYHGLAINVCMDLTPFTRVNPCGLQGMQMTQICEFVPKITLELVAEDLSAIFKSYFSKHTLSKPL
ncbi:lipoyl(octanoyl) transferase LipB [Thiosulfativibrio zosterae]|uniref:Octanoyltransferase n=1 Tax=Thiosulfativibrio zosterae TaxID=2675053 RepID=A0A6F8PLR6_9GAMM|nr:lipoyl(octanoyl) transferase LipB [Thiosulfativibrio zosterae]BBP43018.1 octanoyltransferase [Thiosulfativibrio zosterae]